MLGNQAVAGEKPSLLAPKRPHFPTKVKRIIFLFMEGAISGVDTWDYKEKLQKNDGKVGPGGGKLTASKFKFQQYGQTGTWLSELYPHLSKHVDKLCFIRGLHTDTPAHPQAVHSTSYGNGDCPIDPALHGFVVALRAWDRKSGFARIHHDQPAAELWRCGELWKCLSSRAFPGNPDQRHRFRAEPETANGPVPPAQASRLDPGDESRSGGETRCAEQVEGIIQSYELAFKMQRKVPELLDISREPQKVLDLYGVKAGPAGSFARQCLMARRLSEAGVRFVEICQSGWDHHSNLHKGLIGNCAATDQPTAALLSDLEQRGLLDETLVLFGSEFGRQPTAQGPDGRDHNITGYPMWLAGAGVKKGYSYGKTDEYGIHAVEGRMHTTDLHATLLALMGLNHEKLTYRYAGRDFRLTDVAGDVATEIFA